MHLLLRLLHLSSAIIFVGGIFARQAVRSLTARAPDAATLQALTQAAGKVERLMVIPGNLLAIVSGLALALVTRAPIVGFMQGASQDWLLASIAILVLLFPLVPLVFLPRGKSFEAALSVAVRMGPITPELRALMADRAVRWAHWAEMAGVGLIVALMVLKPF